MNMKEIISAINNTDKFCRKEYKLPYSVRRAIRKNLVVLGAEYTIFDAERERMLAESGDDKEATQAVCEEIIKIMEQEVEVDIEKVPESDLSNLELPYLDELAIDYMLLWPEETEEVNTDERGN